MRALVRIRHLPKWIALAHLAAFVATVAYVQHAHDGQAPMVWVYWAVVDFPVSLLYLLPPNTGLESVTPTSPIVAQLLYMPHWLHGVLGTIWWYALSRTALVLGDFE